MPPEDVADRPREDPRPLAPPSQSLRDRPRHSRRRRTLASSDAPQHGLRHSGLAGELRERPRGVEDRLTDGGGQRVSGTPWVTGHRIESIPGRARPWYRFYAPHLPTWPNFPNPFPNHTSTYTPKRQHIRRLGRT